MILLGSNTLFSHTCFILCRKFWEILAASLLTLDSFVPCRTYCRWSKSDLNEFSAPSAVWWKHSSGSCSTISPPLHDGVSAGGRGGRDVHKLEVAKNACHYSLKVGRTIFDPKVHLEILLFPKNLIFRISSSDMGIW